MAEKDFADQDDLTTLSTPILTSALTFSNQKHIWPPLLSPLSSLPLRHLPSLPPSLLSFVLHILPVSRHGDAICGAESLLPPNLVMA